MRKIKEQVNKPIIILCCIVVILCLAAGAYLLWQHTHPSLKKEGFTELLKEEHVPSEESTQESTFSKESETSAASSNNNAATSVDVEENKNVTKDSVISDTEKSALKENTEEKATTNASSSSTSAENIQTNSSAEQPHSYELPFVPAE